MNERINRPISTGELERRWKAIRAAMALQKIDALIIQNNNDSFGGYVKYFTDFPATNGNPTTVVFPADDLMTVVRQGGFGVKLEYNGANEVWRGVKHMRFAPAHHSAWYTQDYDPEIVADALSPYAKGKIGIVSPYSWSYANIDYLKRTLDQATFVDFTDPVDRLMVIKSEEELEACALTASIQDGAMKAAFAAAKPGMTDREVAAVAQHYCHSRGTEIGIYLCGSGPLGTPVEGGPWHMMGRTIQPGDRFTLLVETNGPGGYFTELARSALFGKVPQYMKDELALVVESRNHTLDMLKPGTPCKHIWDEHNLFMERHGRAKQKRLYCHGQGYQLVERPLVRADEPMEIQANMNIVCHPGYVWEGNKYGVCDNYFITANGPSDRVHKYPVEITELA